MKKNLLFMILIVTCVFLTSCMGNGTQPSTADDEIQPEPWQNVSDTANNVTGIDTPAFIGEEKAKETALKHAGLSADGVMFDRVELDNDNGIWTYEVEFSKDGTEYDVEIKADDGTVLSSDADYND